MDIRWLGQATFEIKTAVGTVLTDPYPGLFQSLPVLDPNTVVTLSRKTGGRPVGLPSEVTLFDRPGEYEHSGLIVRGVAVPAADPETSHAVNTVYLIDAEGVSICILGQPGAPPDSRGLQAITPVDIALVTVDGAGMPPEQRAVAVRQLDPKLVVPTGYDPERGAPGPQLGRFLKDLGVKQVDPQPRLTATRSNLPPDIKVVVLTPRV